ncbi:mannosyl transferase [Candidatus Woesearchaeota archaeon CG10_big_fil_rev_8_21_14_0_10_44_13]|nr:MAG: mannosyl transferase [Candidatus Woesearchaeota archaeon CG10_big_fil_rev_8_21_14_0_10_44_13]
MKVGIFHDHIDSIGGGEKVILALARALDADIITTDLNEDSVRKLGYGGVRIISIGNTIKLPPFKQIHASIKFSIIDLSKEYDAFILSGNWSLFAAKKHQPNMWCCYTPVRAFYDLYSDFRKERSFLTKPIFMVYAWAHRKSLQSSLNHVNGIIAISKNCRERIKKYHHMDSVLIYPGIDTLFYKHGKKGDYWLSVNRLYPQKRIDLQIEAFRKMPGEKLVIVGGYAKGDHAWRYIRKLKIPRGLPENITYLGTVSEKELGKLYGGCIGFITTAQDEDFGLTPLEAMAAGKPVIATDEGGYKETVIDGVTGILVSPEAGSIVRAVKKISHALQKNPDFYREACVKNAAKYDMKIFIQEVKKRLKMQSKRRLGEQQHVKD